MTTLRTRLFGPGRRLLALALGLAAAGPALGQADSLGGLTDRLHRYQQAALPEKLFLHLDRPLYSSGETLWFKVYAVDGTYHTPLALSTVAYVEVLDKTNRPVLQAKVALKQAAGRGSLLLPASLASGAYTVRAYTSWMKNAGPDYYFHGTVTVLNTAAPSGVAAARDSASYDAQFFPEGGSLVQGLASQVGFKVTDKNGHGLAARGQVLADNGQVVASFQTLRLGMGSFPLTPRPGTAYTAVLTLENRQVLRLALPRALEQGYVLRLEPAGPEQLKLTVTATSPRDETLYLLGHSRQQVALTRQLQLSNGRAELVFDKSQLLEGISHLTLFNAARQPLAERLYFRAPQQLLTLSARSDKAAYAIREKVTVQVSAAPAAPVASSLSMAVYRLDSLNAAPAPAIAHYLWLSADLKGRIESPELYFGSSPDAAQAADNLMLTQGWSRFRWEDVLAGPRPPEFLPEPNGPVLQARLSRDGQPRAGVVTYLSSPSRATRLSSSLSAADGLVRFELNDFTTFKGQLVLQTNPLQDSTSRFTLLDPFAARFSAAQPRPAFALAARYQPDYARRHLHTQVQAAFAGRLAAPAPRPAVDSLAFFGKPNETYYLDKYTRFKVLEEVLREYVPGVQVRIRKGGFYLQVVDSPNRGIFDQPPLVLLDGVPIFDMNQVMALNPLKIQKLEVVTGRYFQGSTVYHGVVSFTTYQGNLEGFRLGAHALVQPYEGVQPPREFYAPRYATPQEKQSRLPDLRNLLYWNPDISLNGVETKPLEFYTGDQTGRYLVVLQGLAANGQAGSSSFVLEVKPAL